MAPDLTRRITGPKTAVFLVVLAALVINLPLAHGAYYGWRLDRDGVDTRAVVVDTRLVPEDAEDPEHVVEFRFDRDLDPEQRTWFADVDPDTYERAEADGRLAVRVLPDRPATHEAEGQQSGSLPLVITLLGDLMLLGVAVLYWRFRPTGRDLHLLATADVERCKPGVVVERRDDGLYVVCGDVREIEDGRIVLDLGDQVAHVDLDGHLNEVGYQQPARVVGRPLPDR